MAKSTPPGTRGRMSARAPQRAGRALPKGKAWGGRFAEQTDRLVEQFTSSIAYDRRLYPYDIQGSIAHCKTLERAGVLSGRESSQLVRGLQLVKVESWMGDGFHSRRRMKTSTWPSSGG
ncbi:MAG: lyase family protein [Nitrospira sp.]